MLSWEPRHLRSPPDQEPQRGSVTRTALRQRSARDGTALGSDGAFDALSLISNLPQRGKEAEGAKKGFNLCHLCTFAPLRQTERRQKQVPGIIE